MGELKVKNKDVVVPGEELAIGMDYLPGFGTYRTKESVRASRLGLISIEGRAVKIIPLSGVYSPKKDDTIIGKITDIVMSGWIINLNTAYTAMLNLRDATSEFIDRGADLSQYYAVGDYVAAKITQVTSQRQIDLTMKGPGLRKLAGGRVISINTNKVPRVIGRAGSMVSMIKDATSSRITVGQNGLVWVQGEPEQEKMAIQAIRMIEEQSHIVGLTDKVKAFLDKAKKSK